MNILSGIALAGLSYQYFATRRDQGLYPPPGELVDVDGTKLHIQCRGEGKPTIIVETGIWDFSQSWEIVQSEIAKTMQIVTYDRAGYGWSEKGKQPRTFEQMVKELKILLEKKGIHPPYIFVGHSLGGAIARYFQSQYPEEVAGMIFVDAVHKEAPAFSPIFKVVSKAFSFLAYFGLLKLLFKFSPPISSNPQWTPEMQKRYTGCHQTRTKTLNTCIDEWDGYKESFKALKANARSLKNIPVTIISRDPEKPIRPGVSKEEGRIGLEKLNRQHLEDSPHARFVIAQGSGHLVQIDRPDVVVEEIRHMVDQYGSH
ncbi:MAG: alpha/beta hydrolase [Parachlamydiales bacterium]|nr:alpha/beta hydrolase [Parachlamydiales bacterium]